MLDASVHVFYMLLVYIITMLLPKLFPDLYFIIILEAHSRLHPHSTYNFYYAAFANRLIHEHYVAVRLIEYLFFFKFAKQMINAAG